MFVETADFPVALGDEAGEAVVVWLWDLSSLSPLEDRREESLLRRKRFDRGFHFLDLESMISIDFERNKPRNEDCRDKPVIADNDHCGNGRMASLAGYRWRRTEIFRRSREKPGQDAAQLPSHQAPPIS